MTGPSPQRWLPPRWSNTIPARKDLMGYEDTLLARESVKPSGRPSHLAESRIVTREVTPEEKADLLEAADSLERLGFSAVVFLRRAVDAQERIAQDAGFASARKENEKAIEAIARLLREPDGGPDVLYSPGLLGVLQRLRCCAVPRFAGGPVLPLAARYLTGFTATPMRTRDASTNLGRDCLASNDEGE